MTLTGGHKTQQVKIDKWQKNIPIKYSYSKLLFFTVTSDTGQNSRPTTQRATGPLATTRPGGSINPTPSKPSSGDFYYGNYKSIMQTFLKIS